MAKIRIQNKRRIEKADSMFGSKYTAKRAKRFLSRRGEGRFGPHPRRTFRIGPQRGKMLDIYGDVWSKAVEQHLKDRDLPADLNLNDKSFEHGRRLSMNNVQHGAFSGKPGVPRKHVESERGYFGFRSVVGQDVQEDGILISKQQATHFGRYQPASEKMANLMTELAVEQLAQEVDAALNERFCLPD